MVSEIYMSQFLKFSKVQTSGCINNVPLAVLMGDCINEGFYKKMYSVLPEKKNGCNIEVTTLLRWL